MKPFFAILATRIAPLVLVALLPAVVRAQSDAMQWLQRASQASQKLTYSGVFTYQNGTVAETSRITHLVDADGEAEHLEVLDGSPREVVRIGDEVKCYLPENHTVIVERRSSRRTFPALLPVGFGGIGENYVVRKGESDRVAGLDSQSIVIEPRDQFRYGHRWWVDTQSGLLLKASLIGEGGEVRETFAFSELRIGGPVDRESLKPNVRMVSHEWRVQRSQTTQERNEEGIWQFRDLLPGFRKVSGMKRQSRPNAKPGFHWVFSDGLASVSVFIDAVPRQKEAPETGLFTMGAVNVYKRVLGDHLVVVMGDVPHAALKRLGDGIEVRRK